MMKKFNVTVNGVTYQVEVEEVGGAASTAAPASAPVAAPAPAPVAAPAAPAPAPAPAGGEPVLCPMPGTIIDVLVKPGDSVAKGAVLCKLEAMKMENEIVAARDAVVAGVSVRKGDTVNAGDVLVTLG